MATQLMTLINSHGDVFSWFLLLDAPGSCECNERLQFAAGAQKYRPARVPTVIGERQTRGQMGATDA